MVDIVLPLLNGDCGISGSAEIVQIAEARLPTDCCTGLCRKITYKGTKEFIAEGDESAFVIPFGGVGNAPGTIVVVGVQGFLTEDDEYLITMGCIISAGIATPEAIGLTQFLGDPADFAEDDWTLSVSWCADGEFRVLYQDGTSEPHVGDSNVSDFLPVPYNFGSMFIIMQSFSEGVQVSTLTSVSADCGRIAGDSTPILMFPFVLDGGG